MVASVGKFFEVPFILKIDEDRIFFDVPLLLDALYQVVFRKRAVLRKNGRDDVAHRHDFGLVAVPEGEQVHVEVLLQVGVFVKLTS